MKTKLLKLALCAFAALPIGAWAQQTSWDFTSWSTPTITNLDADVALASGNKWRINGEYKDDTNKNIYGYVPSESAKGSGVTLEANNVAIDELSGLTFDYPKGADGKPRIYIYNQDGRKSLWFKSASTNERVIVPGLTAGKKVTIVSKATSTDHACRMESQTDNVVAYQQENASTGERTDIFVVRSCVSGTIDAKFGASEGHGVNLYSITIADATAEELFAANFGTDDVIKSTTVWTFDQYQANDVIAINSTATNYGGLYMKGHADVSNQSIAGYTNKTATFGDYTVSSYYVYYCKGGKNSTINAAWLNGKTASDVTQDIMAFNVSVAGTAYVAMSSTVADGRTCDLFFSPIDGTYADNPTHHHQITSTGDYVVLTLTNTQAGTYFFSASVAYYISAVRFVPAVASTETKTITMSDMGVMTFSSPQGWQTPAGLTAYTAKKAKTDGTLTLTAVPGNIIPPCTAVILQGTHNTEYTLTAADAAQVSLDKNYYFRPVLCDYALKGEYRYGSEDGSGTSWNISRNNYILAKSGDQMVFALSSGTGDAGDSKLAAGKAYYSIRPDQVKYAAAARMFTLDFGKNETTGIGTVLGSEITVNGEYFNLAGQRVAHPTKGLYVVNGKKVIIK